MVWELIFFLLPVAALSGWLIGRRGAGDSGTENCNLSDDYFRGLNYLLNEQSDKAIEIFIHMVEVDSETVETHFALGNLFLRRGEVDRAIRIHQNLIARPNLTVQQRHQALYELGRDYMRAGLLDRAEALFEKVGEDSEYGPLALRQLLDVYQLEKEWSRAVEIARRLETMAGNKELAPMVAHFYCEQADEAITQHAYQDASRYLRQAIDEDPKSVRATLLSAKVNAAQGDFRKAIRTLRRAEEQDSSFSVEILAPLQEYYQQLNADDELITLLGEMLASGHQHTNIVILMASLLEKRGKEGEARALLRNYVARNPTLRGVYELLEHKRRNKEGADAAELASLAELMHRVLDAKSAYQCRSCGYTTRTLHWQCPSCKGWGSVKPLSANNVE